MCGYVALLTRDGAPVAERHRGAVSSALQRMRARGPDGEGVWDGEGVLLGHRRLAIIDLDTRASQPMSDATGRYVIAFNGEIYNHETLRRDLQARGATFRTTSDTEVILSLFALEGEAMLPKLHGMFSFVIWDRQTRRGFAARDPYGIKPCYIAVCPDGVLIGSQVKALLATGLVSREPDTLGRAGFWLLGSVPEPRTWFRDVRALSAGHCGWFENGRLVRETRWHDLGAAWRNETPPALPDDEIRRRAAEAFRESVARHMVSDVPVGVFLSGGIDSGTMAGLMAETGASGLEGITIAYDEFAGKHEDEAPAAAMIAEHYGIRHTVRRVGHAEFNADLPRALDAMDQPTVDGINTWYAAKATAERGFKVVVSGLGGDELLQGYSHFQQIARLRAARRKWGSLPGTGALLSLAGRMQAWRSGNSRWRFLEAWTRSTEGAWLLRRSLFAPGDLPALMGRDLAEESLRGFDAVEWLRAITGPLPHDVPLAVGQIESTTYLRNQLLRDSDWASMDHSVELRTPLVDARLLEVLTPLLPAFERFPGKSLLAEAPARPLPSAIRDRPKTGFGIPVGRWVTGNLAGKGGGSSRAMARIVAARCYGEGAA